MLASFKPRPLSSGPRTVPCGGLGGCVELKNESPTIEINFQHEMGQSKSRKRPLPIQTNTRNVSRGPLASPVARLGAPLPATPITPFDVSNLTTPIISEFGTTTPSAYELWDRCKDNPWLATVPRREVWSLTPIRRQQTLPIELPGSLLLPSQGFVQSNPPSAPPRLMKSNRRGNNLSISSPLPSLTHSNQTTPEPRDEPLSAFRSPLDKELPKLPSADSEFPGKPSKAFCLMTMAQLLKVLPTLQADEITDQWITVAEREFAKLRGFVFAFSATNNAHQAAFRPFCNEVQRFLKQAQVMCDTHDEEFKRAQESTDINKESDLTKVTNAYNKIGQAMALLPLAGCGTRIQHADFVSLKTILLNSIQVTSGVVRNQMTFQLHKQSGGLPDPLVHLLRHFDNGITMKRKSYLDCIIESDDVGVDIAQKERFPIEPIDPDTSSKDDAGSLPPVTETSQDITEANINSIEVEPFETQDIIESYFDQVSIISNDPDYTTDDFSHYSDQISEVDREFESIQQSPPPQPYQEPEPQPQHPDFVQQQTPSIPPAPIQIPASPPPPHSSLPPSPPIIPIPSTPPPIYSPESTLETLQDRFNLEIATRNSQIDDLRYQIQNLEAHNDLLREHIEGFVQQVDRLESGVGSPTSAGGSGKGFRFSVAALKLSLGIGTGSISAGTKAVGVDGSGMPGARVSTGAVVAGSGKASSSVAKTRSERSGGRRRAASTKR